MGIVKNAFPRFDRGLQWKQTEVDPRPGNRVMLIRLLALATSLAVAATAQAQAQTSVEVARTTHSRLAWPFWGEGRGPGERDGQVGPVFPALLAADSGRGV